MGVGVIVMEVPRISFRSAIFVCTVLEPVMPTADLTRELFRCAFSNIRARRSTFSLFSFLLASVFLCAVTILFLSFSFLFRKYCCLSGGYLARIYTSRSACSFAFAICAGLFPIAVVSSSCAASIHAPCSRFVILRFSLSLSRQ